MRGLSGLDHAGCIQEARLIGDAPWFGFIQRGSADDVRSRRSQSRAGFVDSLCARAEIGAQSQVDRCHQAAFA
jgi:hypothetical protein